MKIGVPGETAPGERRVALIPETVTRLTRAGHTVTIQPGAGIESGYPDQAFESAGASVAGDAAAVIGGSEIIITVQPPSAEQVSSAPSGAIWKRMTSPPNVNGEFSLVTLPDDTLTRYNSFTCVS